MVREPNWKHGLSGCDPRVQLLRAVPSRCGSQFGLKAAYSLDAPESHIRHVDVQRQAIFIIDLKVSRYRSIYLKLIDASCKLPRPPLERNPALCAVRYFLRLYRPTHNCTARPFMPLCSSQLPGSGGVLGGHGRHGGHADGLPLQLGRIRGNLGFLIFGFAAVYSSMPQKFNKSFRLPSQCRCLVVPTRGRIRPGLPHLALFEPRSVTRSTTPPF